MSERLYLLDTNVLLLLVRVGPGGCAGDQPASDDAAPLAG